MAWYTPTSEVSKKERTKGLKYLYVDGLCAHAMALLVTGAFLPGMALALGASSFVIGVLASLAPMSQMMQIPAILLVERLGLRKLITVVLAFISRVSLLFVILIPFFVPENWRVSAFMFCMILFFCAGSIGACSWGSWIKDIVPEDIMGSYMAKRLAAATALGAVLTILAGFGIDSLTLLTGSDSSAYSIIFGIAALFGLYGAKVLIKVPEPKMAETGEPNNFLKSILTPLKDENFRKLMLFNGFWSCTIIMAGAFFAVYMLKRIGLPMSVVVLLAVLSQATNIYFFKVWGSIADRYSNKSVLMVSVPLFIFLILLYPFTTLPEKYSLTIPLLIFIHIIGGISSAGFNLCSANIALKLAPKGKATAYLGTNAFVGGLAATIAPIIGGTIASIFDAKEVSINLMYRADINLDTMILLPAMNIRGIDFVFFTAALVGLYAWHRLSLINEEGTVNETEVRNQVLISIKQSFVNMSSFSLGIRRMTSFPQDFIRKTTQKTTATVSFLSKRR